MARRVVLIGATGFFGRRLARRLDAIEGIELVVASRSLKRAQVLAGTLAADRARRRVTGVAFSRGDPAGIERLRTLSPWLVIDASGPFQFADYGLARAALEIGAHWIDLADARDYLLGFEAALAPLARGKGLVARAGASSMPALSTAVTQELTRGWQRVDTIDVAIMPAGDADVGEAVIRAVLSYAGKPVATFEEGAVARTPGWGTLRRVRVAGLGKRILSPVETADATLLSKRFSVTSRVTFSAGLQSRAEQVGLFLLAKARQRGIVSRLDALARPLRSARRLTAPFASDRGGMTVDCAGIDRNGGQVSSQWLLVSEEGAGPDVPVLPAVALTRALLAEAIKPGAGMAAELLPLSAIEDEMRAPALRTSRSVVEAGKRGLLHQACGDAPYGALPDSLRSFHESAGYPVWTGLADVEASSGVIGGGIRKAFGFPPSGCDIPVTVTVDRQGESEVWTRNFGGRRFVSRLAPEGGNVVSERFGLFKILLGVSAADGEIRMPVIGWRLGPLPLPRFLAPRSDAREFADEDGRFHFDVAISLPLAGRIARYRGWLAPKDASRLLRPAAVESGAKPG